MRPVMVSADQAQKKVGLPWPLHASFTFRRSAADHWFSLVSHEIVSFSSWPVSSYFWLSSSLPWPHSFLWRKDLVRIVDNACAGYRRNPRMQFSMRQFSVASISRSVSGCNQYQKDLQLQWSSSGHSPEDDQGSGIPRGRWFLTAGLCEWLAGFAGTAAFRVRG